MRRAAAQAAANGAASPASSADLVAAWTAFDEMSMAVPRQEAIGLARALRVRLPGVDDDDQQVLPTLTEREREVLALVAAGWSNPRVGEHLFISSKTVSVHLSNAMRKLGVASRTQAALIAQRAGLIPDAALPSSTPGLRSGAATEA
jgi:DNA-binding NarL/FixJ family response regulator